VTLRLEGRSVSGDRFGAGHGRFLPARRLRFQFASGGAGGLSFVVTTPGEPFVTGDMSNVRTGPSTHNRPTPGSNGRSHRDLRNLYQRSEINSRTNTMYDLTGFQRDLLYVIAGKEEPHGLAIKEELEEYYESEIHHGRLYPNLDTLVDKGLVEKGQRDRRTNYYTLTRRGTREIEARREWEAQYVDLD
jgi:DNA-binding MarR family transcriptional regulator